MPEIGNAMLPFKIETPSLSHFTDEDYLHIYEPAEDSFLLLDALEDDLRVLQEYRPMFCVEVGSGSGVISAAISRTLGPGSFCLAVDINEAACSSTLRTAAANNVMVDVVCGDLVKPLCGARGVDLLVFNPPYVPTAHCELETSPERSLVRSWAGGENGREVMDQLFPMLPGLLAPKCLFYMVVIETNNVLEIRETLSTLGFESFVVKQRRVRGEHLMVLRFERKINSSTPTAQV